MNRDEAKAKLDTVIKKSRIHSYKPIQIAEILYHQRIEDRHLNLQDLESYRTKSRKWRDDVSSELQGVFPTTKGPLDPLWKEFSRFRHQ